MQGEKDSSTLSPRVPPSIASTWPLGFPRTCAAGHVLTYGSVTKLPRPVHNASGHIVRVPVIVTS